MHRLLFGFDGRKHDAHRSHVEDLFADEFVLIASVCRYPHDGNDALLNVPLPAIAALSTNPMKKFCMVSKSSA